MNSKQKFLQASASFWLRRGISNVLCGFCIALPASAVARDAVALDKLSATLRLIAAPGPTNGTYVAGIDITMSPGSHTYWKMPGEAGVPPVFSFDGSQNIASAKVLFPTPKRITEEGLVAFGYGDHVVFPVAVVPADPAKPAVLRADVIYAVCKEICLPEHGKAELMLSPDGKTPDGALVTTALAAVPVPLPAAARGKLVLTPAPPSDKPTWTIAWTGDTPIDDVFANAPEGYFFDTKRTGPTSWSLTAAQVVAAPTAAKVPVELTLATKDGGFVTTQPLDVGVAAH